MLKKRPCRIYGGWFRPDPRVGDRQKICSQGCQRKQHRHSCKVWRERESDDESEERIRKYIKDVNGEVVRSRMRNEIGKQHVVIIEEIARVLISEMRDERGAQLLK